MPKAMAKAIKSKKATSYQKRVQLPFRSAVTKAEGRKNYHNEKKETSDQRKASFPLLSLVTKTWKPRKVVIGKITTLGQGKRSFQMG